MSRRCELTDKQAQSGNNVSHAQNKTRRTFKVNIQNITLYSDALKKSISLKIAMSTLRSIDHNGGLDNYLLTTANSKLSEYGQKLKRQIKKVTEVKTEVAKPKTKKAVEKKAA